MRHRAVWHSKRKEVIRRASLEYLDAQTRSATRAGSEKLDDDAFLEVTRAADEPQIFSAQQSKGNHKKCLSELELLMRRAVRRSNWTNIISGARCKYLHV
eukprot:7371448-Pyramimonas_sp.AAC.1